MTITDQIPPIEGIANLESMNGRARILREAASLFLTRGYAETSMRTIAEAADIRPASIYHHFESKDALLTEILTIGMDAVTTAFLDVDAGALRSPRERLEAHVAGHLRALFTNHAFTAAHVTVFPFAPEDVRRAAVPERDAYEAQWTELLSEVAPNLSDEARRVVRLALFGAMNSSVQWFDSAEGSVDDLAETVVTALWQGIGVNQDGAGE
jgi:AcrR family transcriptional regulator